MISPAQPLPEKKINSNHQLEELEEWAQKLVVQDDILWQIFQNASLQENWWQQFRILLDHLSSYFDLINRMKNIRAEDPQALEILDVDRVAIHQSIANLLQSMASEMEKAHISTQWVVDLGAQKRPSPESMIVQMYEKEDLPNYDLEQAYEEAIKRLETGSAKEYYYEISRGTISAWLERLYQIYQKCSIRS